MTIEEASSNLFDYLKEKEGFVGTSVVEENNAKVIYVYVEHKKHKTLIPASYEGFTVTVVVSGKFYAH